MKQVKRVSSKEFEIAVEDLVSEGYGIESKTNTNAVLVKKNFGKPFYHIMIFIFLGWWSLLSFNILYLLYAFFYKRDEVVVKIK